MPASLAKQGGKAEKGVMKAKEEASNAIEVRRKLCSKLPWSAIVCEVLQ